MWTRYNVRFEFLTGLSAGVPADPDIIRRWLESRKPAHRPPEGKSIDEIAEEVIGTLDDVEPEPALMVFQRVRPGPLISGGFRWGTQVPYSADDPEPRILAVGMRTVRGHIKDVVSTLSSLYIGKVKGERSFAVRAKNAVYYPPETYWVPILNAATGYPFVAPSGIRDKALTIMTPQGPRSAIKRLEFVNDAVLEFPLLVLTTAKGTPVIGEADLKTIFMYGGTHGYGPERSDGEGRYAFSLSLATES